MKDEELFRVWKSEQYKDQSTEEKMEFVEHLHTFPKYFETTFLAGLKAGRPQWHDLWKDPNDLPKDEKDVQVLYQDCDKINTYNCVYDIHAENWLYYNLDNMVLELFPYNVIAWKEIVLPKESE